MDVISCLKKKQPRTLEFWREVRGLVERGLSLKKASVQFGLAYSNLVQRSAREGWKLVYRGRPRTLDYPDGTRRKEMALAERRYEEAQEAIARESQVVVIDRAEQLTHRVLATHSAQMKVRLSELVTETAEQLRTDKDIKAKDKALALGALSIVSERLYGWDKEPSLREMEVARTSAAVNLRLIALSPADLARRAREMRADTLERSGQDSGLSASTCNAQEPGSSTSAHTQSSAVTTLGQAQKRRLQLHLWSASPLRSQPPAILPSRKNPNSPQTGSSG
jgi:hypothetical protein